MILLMIVVVYDLAQVYLNPLIFLDRNSINSGGQYIEVLALASSLTGPKIFLNWSTKG